MSQDLSSEGIVLRRTDSSESDRRLTLLTRDYGKIDVIAKGARKGGSRLAGSSEPLIKAKFGWAEGKVRRFVTQVEPMTSFPQVRNDYDRLLAGLALAEVVAASLEYESEALPIYDLMDHSLLALGEAQQTLAVFVWGLARLLVEEGQGPDWMRCIVTDAPVEQSPAAVSAHAGGYVCRELADQYNDVLWVSGQTLIALSKISELGSPPAHLKGAKECAQVLVRFWQGILNRRLSACETAFRELSQSGE